MDSAISLQQCRRALTTPTYVSASPGTETQSSYGLYIVLAYMVVACIVMARPMYLQVRVLKRKAVMACI